MKRLLWLRLVLCVLLVPQLALGAQLPLVVEWMATAPLQLTWTQSTASEASPKPLPIFPHAPAVQSTRTHQGEAQLAQAELDKDELPGLLVLVAEQAGGWGLPRYVMHIGWNEFGQKVRQIAGNFVETKYSYREKTRRLAGIDSFNRDDFQRMQSQPGQYMQQLRYEYDLVGNIVALRNDAPYSNTANASVLIATTSQSFEYDKLYQIKSASGVMQDRNDWRYTYSFAQEYDAVGNIVFKDQSAWRQVPDNGSWRNDNQNRDISYASTYSYGGSQAHAPNVIAEQLPNESSAYSRVLTYDASGNQVQNAFRGHTRSIVWNEDDQVKQVIRDGQELNRTLYDAQGQKAVHLHRVSGNEETAYLGPNLTIRDGKYITKHVFAGSERVSSKMDPAWFQYPPTMYYHSDHLGSAQYVTIDSQEMVQHAEYLPSGELWQNASDSRFELARRFLFTGKELDIHTGLYDFGARQYDARQGQWLSPDPILAQYMYGAPNAGVYLPANQSLYSYSYNNALSYVDANGETPWIAAGVAAALDTASQFILIGIGQQKEFSFVSVGISAVAGASGAGLVGVIQKSSKIAALGWKAKFGAEVAVDAAISATSTAAKGDDVSVEGVLLDVTVGQAVGHGASKAAGKKAAASDEGKFLKRAADRAARIADPNRRNATRRPARQAARERRAAEAADVHQEYIQSAESAAGIVGANAAQSGANILKEVGGQDGGKKEQPQSEYYKVYEVSW